MTLAGDSKLKMNTIRLNGCAPVPLAHYLKALGILRLVAEQADTEARGSWEGEHFLLHTTLDENGLQDFFLHKYRPTPILAPWNGGSGFASKDKNQAKVLNGIARSRAGRFSPYVQGISAARAALAKLGLTEKPSTEQKEALLTLCRSSFPDSLMEWLDAALVLTADGAKYPPLLGTGGNDGRLEFTNNHMKRLQELFEPATGQPQADSENLLRNALFGEAVRGLSSAAIGQFFPDAAGGANASNGFDGNARVNPWDFVLMLEGSLLFAAAAVKRLENANPTALAYPFCVRPAGCGYASSSEADPGSARCEIWTPLWKSPVSLPELRHTLAEGRAELRDKAARDGLDFARAVMSLGVDRGLKAFQRYSFQARNGLAYFATPLDRVPVRRRRNVSELIDELDRSDWLDRVRRAAGNDKTPGHIRAAVHQVEQAAIDLCRSSQQEQEERARVEALLIAVADVEAVLSRSVRWAKDKFINPLPPLSARWFWKIRDGSAECDLAAGLASLARPGFRIHWQALERDKPYPVWKENSREVLWHDDRLLDSLLAVHLRRLILQEQAGGKADYFAARWFVRPSHLAAFLDGDVDERRLARLARAFSLVQFSDPSVSESARMIPDSETEAALTLPAAFSLLKLALAGQLPGLPGEIPRVPAILRRAASDSGLAATELAVRRLRASSFAPAVRAVPVTGPAVRRAAAATLFPLSTAALESLMEALRPLTTVA